MKYHLYTDGACQPNPGQGGWGYVLKPEIGKEVEGAGGVADTTNNRMELQAVLEGLIYFSTIGTLDDVCVIYSDSKYLLDGLSDWSFRWEKNNWCKKNDKPVMNVDIWKDIRKIADKLDLEYVHIKGHSGHEYNERCDKLAVGAIKKNG